MKKYLMIFGFVLGLTPVVNNPLFAQQNIFIKKKYFTMPPRVKSTDYYHGMIQVKLKPEFRSALSGSQREISKRLKILETMQISSVQQAVPKGIKDYSNARYDKPFKFDPGLYQLIYFNNTFPVEKAVNILSSTGRASGAAPDEASLIPDRS